MTTRVAWAVVCAAITLPSAALAVEPHVLDARTERVSVGTELEVLEDPDGSLDLEQVLSPEVSAHFTRAPETPSYGFTGSVYWVRFALVSHLDGRSEWLLEVGYPLLDHLTLYIERADGSYEHRVAGDRYPFSQREVAHAHYLFRIAVDPGRVTHVYLRAETESAMQLPMRLWAPSAFAQYEFRRQIGQGVYYGAMLVMVLFNLFIFISVRDRSYLFYGFYVASIVTWQAGLDGLAYEYLWPSSPSWNSVSLPVSLGVLVICAAAFVRAFLHLRETMPGWNRVITVLIGAGLVQMVVGVVAPYSIAIRSAASLGGIGALIVLLCGIHALRRGNRAARFYVVAWASFLLGSVIFTLAKFGLVPSNLFTENGQQIGSLLEVVLLSFALADRFRIIKKEATENLEREVERQTHELREQAEKLKELDKTKTQFFSNVSHEFRTPLTLTIGPLEGLLEGRHGSLEPAQREQLEVMLRNSRRLLRLINQLLDVTRLESGRMMAAFQPRDLGQFVSAVVDTFRPYAEAKGIEVGCTVEQSAVVYIDPDRFDKILFNLLSNACKFAPGGTIEVTVREAPAEARAEGLACELSVRDDGIGIRADELPNIFERFRQADGSTTRAHEGTGLGLALTKELVELHGGAIEATSEPGAGTTMTVRLRSGKEHLDPGMVQEEASEDEFLDQRAAVEFAEIGVGTAGEAGEERDIGPESAATPPAEGGARRAVLVVDDNADLRGYLARVLDAYEVRTAADGLEALQSIEGDAPSLVISDVMMPNMDGYELCAAIKGNPVTAHIPVILVTAQAGLDRKLEGLSVRADDYLTKPFHPDELLARVRNLLAAASQSEALRSLNRELEQRVLEQADELRRQARLGQFLPPSLAERLLSGEASLEPARCHVVAVRMEIATFEGIAGELDAESLAALVGQFHTLASEQVFAREGTIISLHDCSLKAVFGGPVAMEETQAATIALAFVADFLARLTDLAKAWRDVAPNQPIIVRGGVSSGMATVGAFGSGDWSLFTAVGDPIVEAGCLTDYAAYGEVLAAAHTAVSAGAVDPGTEPFEVSLRDRTLEAYRLPVPDAVSSQSIEVLPPGQTITDTDQTLVTGPSRRSETERIELGATLGGRFRIARKLGGGGMGTVYEAEDLVVGDTVALKMFRGESPRDEERIRREVRLTRLVTHANVCRVFDLHVLAGRPGLTMELIRGASLRAHLELGAVDLDQLLRWAIPACNGLRAAHACGILHRDLKPENILIEETGRPVLVDFGIARPVAGKLNDSFEGTLDYVAPEQVVDNRSDARSDIFSFGVVLFEMATNRLPYVGETALVRALARGSEAAIDPLAIVPGLNPGLAALITRCLAREPTGRFARVADLFDGLQRIALRAGCAWREVRPPGRPTVAREPAGDAGAAAAE